MGVVPTPKNFFLSSYYEIADLARRKLPPFQISSRPTGIIEEKASPDAALSDDAHKNHIARGRAPSSIPTDFAQPPDISSDWRI